MSVESHNPLAIHPVEGEEAELLRRRQIIRRVKLITIISLLLLAVGAVLICSLAVGFALAAAFALAPVVHADDSSTTLVVTASALRAEMAARANRIARGVEPTVPRPLTAISAPPRDQPRPVALASFGKTQSFVKPAPPPRPPSIEAGGMKGGRRETGPTRAPAAS